jgi:alkyldihydroxyacetonephosphate synthase
MTCITPCGSWVRMARERIVPSGPLVADNDIEKRDAWGFHDCGFDVLPDGTATFRGRRYPLHGSELPDMLPYFRKAVGVDIDASDRHPSRYPPAIPSPRVHAAFSNAIAVIEQTADDVTRLRHGHGHTIQEIYAIRYGSIARVPDLVVFPADEAQVQLLLNAAVEHDVVLIPYGGGTNVTDALLCPANEERFTVSVDMRHFNRVLWIDPENMTACIQAGVVGRHLNVQLGAHGYTLGHDPDSIELSTLGGWIATNASGMKKNRYGNIEDLVIDVHMVTVAGELRRPAVTPRESIGGDPGRLAFGSEGTLGIITSAVVKIFPLPEVQQYDAVLFPTFEQGFAFLYDLQRSGAVPASVRLVDPQQFQLGHTFRPRSAGLKRLMSRAERYFVTRVRGFDVERMVAATVLYEGTRSEVAVQAKTIRTLARRHGGMRAGAENGRRGYQLTFSIAYIRDFGLDLYILGESFETSVAWSDALALCENVKRRVRAEHAALRLPGYPFISCRVTQLYQTGVCVYFYLAFHHKGVADPIAAFAAIETAARDEILRSGGSLSHHHGVGKIRSAFLPRVLSPAALEWAAGIKHAIDPANIFGSRNHQPPGPDDRP